MQVLHIGTYDDEAPVLATCTTASWSKTGSCQWASITKSICQIRAKASPEKLKTILRQPVRAA